MCDCYHKDIAATKLVCILGYPQLSLLPEPCPQPPVSISVRLYGDITPDLRHFRVATKGLKDTSVNFDDWETQTVERAGGKTSLSLIYGPL